MATEFADVLARAAHAVAVAAVGYLGGRQAALGEFPFLEQHLEPPEPAAWPRLERLAKANGLDDAAVVMLLAVGLVEEDTQFAVLFEALQAGGGRRPTFGLLARLLPGGRQTLRRLVALGLVQVVDAQAPRADAALEVPFVLFDLLAGGSVPDWLHWRERGTLALADLVVADEVRQIAASWRLAQMPLLVRGPANNGRAALLVAAAGAQGLDAIEVALPPTDPRVAWLGHIATMLDALLVWRLEPAPGETLRLPRLVGATRSPGLVLPRHGGVDGELVATAMVVQIEMPTRGLREELWRRLLPLADARALASAFRLTTGTMSRVGRCVRGQLGEPTAVPDVAAVRRAARAVRRAGLEQLATLLPAVASADLIVGDDVQREIEHLVQRCARREQLASGAGPALRQLGAGVRALFSGASGTGKTMAARVVAGRLERDLYRLDLGAIVNKYIGETEKNLERVFALAEQLDVILLLDEGDSLLARRTAVGSAQDRYANLETNFLLQRLETYDGIVLVTSNAADRIDPAFARRMDVVIEFPLPEVAERRSIWCRHLPAWPKEDAAMTAAVAELADAARLTGAQIKNAAIFAVLLAAGGPVRVAHLRVAVAREFTKMGAPSPLWSG